MKVKDLIDFLSKGNEEAEIIIRSSAGIIFDIDKQRLFMEAFGDKIKEKEQFNIRIK